jgi:hypothetical protein
MKNGQNELLSHNKSDEKLAIFGLFIVIQKIKN